MNENRPSTKKYHRKKPILKENSVYLNQSPVRQSREQKALKNLEILSSHHTLNHGNDDTDFGGWDDTTSSLPKQQNRKSQSQYAQRMKAIPVVQVRKRTPNKIPLKLSKPSPLIQYPIQQGSTCSALSGMSEYFGNERFHRIMHGMNSIVLSRRVRTAQHRNRILSSKSFM